VHAWPTISPELCAGRGRVEVDFRVRHHATLMTDLYERAVALRGDRPR
jgi:hypothetical protein